jgi:hypothetical protein
MKKLVITTALVGLVAASSFAQGTIGFKTTLAKDGIYSATDGTTASLALVPTTGTVGSFGAVSYEFLTAPSTTALLTSESQFFGVNGLIIPSGWTGTLMGPAAAYTGPGIVTLQTVTIVGDAGAAGLDVEIVAFTGTSSAPTLFGYSGQTFPTLTTANGSFSWEQATGNPNATPQGTPTAPPTGAGGLGSLILVPAIPEPSTIALGGMAAAALLAFRRRK